MTSVTVKPHEAGTSCATLTGERSRTLLTRDASTLPTPAAPPGDLTASRDPSGAVLLQWSDNSSNETEFYIYRSIDGRNFYSYLTRGANANPALDGNAGAGQTYHYRVYALGGGMLVGPSNDASISLGAQPSGTPSSLQAVALSTTDVRLTWTDNSTDETACRIYRNTQVGSEAVVGTTTANVATFTDTGRVPGETH